MGDIQKRHDLCNDTDLKRTCYRQRYFPTAVENVRKKLLALEREAREIHMPEYIAELEFVRLAWDRARKMSDVYGEIGWSTGGAKEAEKQIEVDHDG